MPLGGELVEKRLVVGALGGNPGDRRSGSGGRLRHELVRMADGTPLPSIREGSWLNFYIVNLPMLS